MTYSTWDEKIKTLQMLVMKPTFFSGLKITLIDVLSAYHQKGWKTDDHRHPWFEFNYISSGTMTTSFKEEDLLTKKGQYLLIPPGIYHNNHNLDIDDGFCLRWQIEVLDDTSIIHKGTI